MLPSEYEVDVGVRVVAHFDDAASAMQVLAAGPFVIDGADDVLAFAGEDEHGDAILDISVVGVDLDHRQAEAAIRDRLGDAPSELALEPLTLPVEGSVGGRLGFAITTWRIDPEARPDAASVRASISPPRAIQPQGPVFIFDDGSRIPLPGDRAQWIEAPETPADTRPEE